MSKQWYVVHTYSGHENKVKTNLERAIASAGMHEMFGEIIVATEEFAEMRDGRRTVSKRKTFPSYVLIEMEMCDETRHLVTNVPGVTRFVGSGNLPLPMSNGEVERIKGRIEGTTDDREECPYRVGDHVQVTDGPFSDFTGVVDEVNAERTKLKVMVSIFGRATPVELDFLQVKSV
ncbi:MAG: transcription termination/antitermination protein NusG [Candidatus Eiseniibacteriota bacterium]|jgi:transcriptional antiterminator NusG